jgi:hypothetical protein
MEATRERLCGGRGQIGPTRSIYACAAVNADNGALSGRCWPAHILGAAELYAENPWPDTPEVFTATYQALEAYAWRSDSETARADVTAEPVVHCKHRGHDAALDQQPVAVGRTSCRQEPSGSRRMLPASELRCRDRLPANLLRTGNSPRYPPVRAGD